MYVTLLILVVLGYLMPDDDFPGYEDGEESGEESSEEGECIDCSNLVVLYYENI